MAVGSLPKLYVIKPSTAIYDPLPPSPANTLCPGRLTGLHVACNILMVVGFVSRTLGAFDTENIYKYMVSQIAVMAAPPLYELSNFYLLGRILYFVPYHAPVHPGRVLSTFGFLSFLVEVLNGLGAGWTSNPALGETFLNLGKNLIRASLIIQIIVITLFLALASTFWHRCHRSGLRNAKVTQTLITLYASNTLILARCLYRTVEYFHLTDFSFNAGDASTLPAAFRYEAYFYVFEASLLLINTALIAVRHPRRWLPKSTKVYLAKDYETEIMGPGYKEQRPFLATLCDPFDMMGMIQGKKDKTDRFWDHDGVGGPSQQGGQHWPKELQQLRPSRDSIDSHSDDGHGTHYPSQLPQRPGGFQPV